MRARNREINIFNMSLLDILCGALGAFCFMMLTLFPYYSKAHKQDATPSADSAELQRQYARAQQKLQETESRIRQLEAESARAAAGGSGGGASAQQLQQAWNQLQGLRQELEAASKRIEKLELRFPVAVEIMWLTDKHDVDIYLVRPATVPQPRPVLNHKNNVWINGDSRTDWVSGPGFEGWQMRDLPRDVPAELYYILFNSNGNAGPAYIAGTVLCPDGALRIPPVQMDEQSRILHVADIIRDNQDKLELHFSPEFQQHAVGRTRASAAPAGQNLQAWLALERGRQELNVFRRPWP